MKRELLERAKLVTLINKVKKANLEYCAKLAIKLLTTVFILLEKKTASINKKNKKKSSPLASFLRSRLLRNIYSGTYWTTGRKGRTFKCYANKQTKLKKAAITVTMFFLYLHGITPIKDRFSTHEFTCDKICNTMEVKYILFFVVVKEVCVRCW